MKRPGMAGALIRIALHAFPCDFRRRHGAALRQSAEDRLARDGARRRPAATVRLGAVLVNLLAAGVGERIAGARERWLWPSHQGQPTRGGRPAWIISGGLAMDVRQALRLFRRSPLFAIVGVLALALGIGGNIAIFTVVNAVLLRPLPYDDAARLVMVWSDNRPEGRNRNPISPADFLDLRSASGSFSGMEAMYSFLVREQFAANADPEVVDALAVTPGMFTLLGRHALLGRTFRAGETEGVILSHAFWQRRFGADPSVVGRAVVVGSLPAPILGVMPADFVFPYRSMLGPGGFTRAVTADMWMPLDLRTGRMVDAQGRPVRAVRVLAAVARLKPAVTMEHVRADLVQLARGLERAYPDTNKGWGASVVPLYEQTVGDVRGALVLLLAGVGLLLLMACVNVANLVLARCTARQHEIAVRSALGAGRFRLVRQVLTETLLLSCAGALVALLAVTWGIDALVAIAPAEIPRLQDVRADVTVLAFAVLCAIATGVVAGLVPALAATASRACSRRQSWLRERTHTGARRVRSMLVVAEVALAVVLAIGALLLGRSFQHLLDVDPGFRADHLLTLQMNVPDRYATPEARRHFYREFFDRIGALPGVRNVGGTTRLPLGSTNVTTQVAVEGREIEPARLPEVEFRRALRNYFATMGIPILRGRGFDDRDSPEAPPVAVINLAAARRLFPGEEPVGRRVRMGPDPAVPWMTIVGVVGDVRHASLDTEPVPELYIYYLQNPPIAPFIVVRTEGDPGALAAAVRATARQMDRDLTLYDVRTMDQVRADSGARRRFLALLAGLFGALAVALAGAGVYGVMALVVAERTREIGVRLALGARPAHVWLLVAGEGLTLAAAGVVVGLGLARLAVPFMASQLFGIGAGDPATLVAVPLVLLLAAVTACYLPARRAMAVDPCTALRWE